MKQEIERWEAYIDYLMMWAEDRRSILFYGNSPVCFDDFKLNEEEKEK